MRAFCAREHCSSELRSHSVLETTARTLLRRLCAIEVTVRIHWSRSHQPLFNYTLFGLAPSMECSGGVCPSGLVPFGARALRGLCPSGLVPLEATARSKSQFETTVRSHSSKSPFEVTVRNHLFLNHISLCPWTLLHLAPCMDMHRFTLVYIYIYIYVYTCI